MHFSCYYRYMEEAEHAFWRAAGLALTDAGTLGFPRVSSAFEYHAPLRFDDEFDAELQIAAIVLQEQTNPANIQLSPKR